MIVMEIEIVKGKEEVRVRSCLATRNVPFDERSAGTGDEVQLWSLVQATVKAVMTMRENTRCFY